MPRKKRTREQRAKETAQQRLRRSWGKTRALTQLLKEKYKIASLLSGESAKIYDCAIEEVEDKKVVAYASQMKHMELPLSGTQEWDKGAVTGSFAHAFFSDKCDNYVGYVMGNLVLKPGGIKGADKGPACLTFTVCTGQAKALELAFGDPDDSERKFVYDTAQRFFLGPGDMFRVPPGNTYRLVNHSISNSCMVSWTWIKPIDDETKHDDGTERDE